MIKSMTGFGRAQETVDGSLITVEVKSVNHRYFEFSAKTPRAYGFLEEKLKSYIQSKISRGKVECYVSIETLDADDVEININHSLAGAYCKAFCELAEKYGIDNDISVSVLSRYGDIFSVRKKEADEDKLWQSVLMVLEKAVDGFIQMKCAEGEKLRSDILSRADYISGYVDFIERRSPETVKEYNEKLRIKIRELIDNAQVDEQRLLTEAAIFADKIAVDEETVRLRSHLDQLKAFFDIDGAIGRKMDFLIQEINREANTIGSKAQDVDIAKRVIDIKAEVEKIREQIQNIE